jgi:hypothetical protein
MMKRAMIGIANVGILALTVGVGTANAQSYGRYGPTRTYTKPTPPKAAARFAARAFRALFRFPTRTVRKPQAVVASATIKPSRTGEKPTYRCRRGPSPSWWSALGLEIPDKLLALNDKVIE